MSDFYTADIA